MVWRSGLTPTDLGLWGRRSYRIITYLKKSARSDWLIRGITFLVGSAFKSRSLFSRQFDMLSLWYVIKGMVNVAAVRTSSY